MKQLVPGLVSVTFRSLTPSEIITLGVEADIEWIEWGGDIHVPAGDLVRAREVCALTEAAGLKTAAYGSYYRVGNSATAPDFEKVLSSAAALKVPLIRVWAGDKSSLELSQLEQAEIVRDSQRICDLAVSEGIQIAYEFHGGTLTDTLETTLSLIAAVDRPNLRTLWQPLGFASPSERISEVKKLLPWLANVHVYHGTPGSPGPLALGEQEWREILAALAKASHPIGLLIEFVDQGAPEQFLADAAALQSWLEAL